MKKYSDFEAKFGMIQILGAYKSLYETLFAIWCHLYI